MRIKVFFKRTVVILLACVLLITWSAPRADALALEIGAGVIVTAFAAYLATSGITYAASGGDKSDIINSIQTQITPWVNAVYGSWDNYIASVKVLVNPLSLLNGKLAISKALVDVFARARQWLIDNIFSDTDNVVVDSVSGGITVSFRGYGSATAYDGVWPSNKSFESSYWAVFPGDLTPWPAAGKSSRVYIPIDTLNAVAEVRLYHGNDYPRMYFELHPSIDYDAGNWYSGIGASTSGRYNYYSNSAPLYWYYSVILNYPSEGRFSVAGFASDTLVSDGTMLGSLVTPGSNYPMINNFGSEQWSLIGDVSSSDSYGLTSTYDNAVTPATVLDGEALTIDTDKPFVTGIDDQLYDILQGIQDSVGAIEGSVTAGAVDVAPAAYQSPSDYMIALTELFPFCLPWDIARGLAIFEAEPVAPSVTWDMPLPLGGTYPVTIDLSSLDSVAMLLRRLELLASVIGLAYVTRRYLRF